ncbi:MULTISPECIES: carbon-nitrogen hydrolase family protein [unclassified Ensifer]|uniref:carbon-nitrogen hydrolase family protein n=1 Tax=unclassified Ensifer TaxID=2633371 RepID=UPI0008139731|nr:MULTISPECIES: carbon-nitrogen hydrolase family protein [unclassified Ensifer]OCP19683.1 hydrolase [Ensifer sp. LC54]OCP19714.1 hydrolase [Ensifer sp. LC384]
MKIAAAQTVVSKDLSENADTIRQILSDAASEGVRLVSFCEGALSGYSKAQITDPDDWLSFDWRTQEAELRSIANLCGKLGIFAVVGGAHMLSATGRPHNSLYIFSAAGELLTRYDKRFLSNSEVNDWYTPGTDPIVFEADGYRFGCAVCMESQFPEVFSEYERLAADVVLFSSYGIPEHFQIALRAHAGLNCLWISAATPAQKAPKGPAGIIGPDGKWSALCVASTTSCYVAAVLDRDNPAYDIPLQKARPWRKQARLGDIYREKIVNDPRSMDRKQY